MAAPPTGSGRPTAIWIRGKGRTEKERMTLPDQTAGALAKWIEARGNEPGPFFHRLDCPKPTPDVRLSGESVRRIVRRLGKAAGLPRDVRSHGLRHSTATSALNAGREGDRGDRISDGVDLCAGCFDPFVGWQRSGHQTHPDGPSGAISHTAVASMVLV